MMRDNRVLTGGGQGISRRHFVRVSAFAAAAAILPQPSPLPNSGTKPESEKEKTITARPVPPSIPEVSAGENGKQAEALLSVAEAESGVERVKDAAGWQLPPSLTEKRLDREPVSTPEPDSVYDQMRTAAVPSREEVLNGIVKAELSMGSWDCQAGFAELVRDGAFERREDTGIIQKKLESANEFLSQFGIKVTGTHWDFLDMVQARYDGWLKENETYKRASEVWRQSGAAGEEPELPYVGVDPSKRELDMMIDRFGRMIGQPPKDLIKMVHLFAWRESGGRGRFAAAGHGDNFHYPLGGIMEINPDVVDRNRDRRLEPWENGFYWGTYLPKKEEPVPWEEVEKENKVASFKVIETDPGTGKGQVKAERVMAVPADFVLDDAFANLAFGLAIVVKDLIYMAAEMQEGGPYRDMYEYYLEKKPDCLFAWFSDEQNERLTQNQALPDLLDGKGLFMALLYGSYHSGASQARENIVYYPPTVAALERYVKTQEEQGQMTALLEKTKWGRAVGLAVWSWLDPQWEQARYFGPGLTPETMDEEFYYNVPPDIRERKMDIADLPHGEILSFQDQADLFWSYFYEDELAENLSQREKTAKVRVFFCRLLEEHRIYRHYSPELKQEMALLGAEVFDQLPSDSQERGRSQLEAFFASAATAADYPVNQQEMKARYQKAVILLERYKRETRERLASLMMWEKSVCSRSDLEETKKPNPLIEDRTGRRSVLKEVRAYRDLVREYTTGENEKTTLALLDRLEAFFSAAELCEGLNDNERLLISPMIEEYSRRVRILSSFSAGMGGVQIASEMIRSNFEREEDLLRKGYDYELAYGQIDLVAKVERAKRVMKEVEVAAGFKPPSEANWEEMTIDEALAILPPAEFDPDVYVGIYEGGFLPIRAAKILADYQSPDYYRILTVYSASAGLRGLKKLAANQPAESELLEQFKEDILKGLAASFNPGADYKSCRLQVSDFLLRPIVKPYLSDDPPENFDIKMAYYYFTQVADWQKIAEGIDMSGMTKAMVRDAAKFTPYSFYSQIEVGGRFLKLEREALAYLRSGLATKEEIRDYLDHKNGIHFPADSWFLPDFRKAARRKGTNKRGPIISE